MSDPDLAASHPGRTEPPPSIGTLRAVTSTAPDLAAVEATWTEVMGYEVVSRAPAPAATATGWGAPDVSGRPMLVMRPAGGEPTYLRFIQLPDPPGHKPLTTPGWAVIEIVVADPDALAERLQRSAFKVLAAPHGIDTYPYLRAMQATGPAGEHLNLTLIKPAQPGLPVASAFVGHCFIATLGVPDMRAAQNFYGRLGAPVSAAHPVPLTLINQALGLPAGTPHPLAAVSLAGSTKIELDAFPAGCGQRFTPPGGLPAGLAVVTFECPDLDAVDAPFIAPPAPCAMEPHRGRRSATIVGTAGELIELVETP